MSAYEYFRPTKWRVLLAIFFSVILVFSRSLLSMTCTYTASYPGAYEDCMASFVIKIAFVVNYVAWPAYLFAPFVNIMGPTVAAVFAPLMFFFFVLWVYFLVCCVQFCMAKVREKVVGQ